MNRAWTLGVSTPALRQFVPEAWVKASTTAYSVTDRGSMGYGYLWWTLNPDVFGPGAALASGYGGQAIAIVPAKHLVLVQTVDLADNAKGVRTSHFSSCCSSSPLRRRDEL
jgi:CubicO group peptidase (beta-lactamase class C family)